MEGSEELEKKGIGEIKKEHPKQVKQTMWPLILVAFAMVLFVGFYIGQASVPEIIPVDDCELDVGSGEGAFSYRGDCATVNEYLVQYKQEVNCSANLVKQEQLFFNEVKENLPEICTAWAQEQQR